MSYTLGLDVGTQSTKALLLDTGSGDVIARASCAYGLIEGLPEGAAEQDPRTWREAVRAVVQDVLREPEVNAEQIVAVGVSGQQHGCVTLDASDEPVRAAKLWCDTATASEASELSELFGREVPAGFTASKLLWLARREPDNWKRTARVLLPHDYVNLLLTGEAAMECGDASGTGFFDVRARKFDGAAVESMDRAAGIAGDVGLAARLPRLLNPQTPQEALGRVTSAAAQEFGLAEGTLVSRGGGDNMMSAIGSGATSPGVVTLSMGTSGTVFANSDEPVIDPEGLIAPFCGSAGGWLPLLCVMNLTGVTEEVRAGFDMDHAELTRRASDVPAGCDGLLWLPYLNGERVPNLPQASGTLLGMRAGHVRPGVLYRAALEGTSLNLAWGVERLRALGVATNELRLVGGAANNPLWRSILAACLDAPVLQLAESESAALGAALQASWSWHGEQGTAETLASLGARSVRALGEPSAPNAQLVGEYGTLGERFKAQVERLHAN